VAERVVNRIYNKTSVGDHVSIVYLLQERDDGPKPSFAFVDEPSPVFGAIGCFVFSLAFVGVGIAAILSSFAGAGK
jgi:hypothetical protein